MRLSYNVARAHAPFLQRSTRSRLSYNVAGARADAGSPAGCGFKSPADLFGTYSECMCTGRASARNVALATHAMRQAVVSSVP